MDTSTRRAAAGQISTAAAEIYDSFFVPALFGEWAEPLCRAAGLSPGEAVLDVACGTGATTRAAQAAVGPTGAVTGLDCNAGMLAVARAHGDGIGYVEGRAEALPFEDRSQDAVLCQFGLMFMDDRPAALRQMARVLRSGGRVALTVWDRVETSPGYAGMIALLQRLFGADVADALRAPFNLGELALLGAVLRDGGMDGAQVTTERGTARFASIAEWVRMDVRGWTLSDMIDDDQFQALVSAAETEFAGLADASGQVSFAAPAHIVTWRPA